MTARSAGATTPPPSARRRTPFNAQQQAIDEQRPLEAQDEVRVRRQRADEDASQRAGEPRRANARRQTRRTQRQPQTTQSAQQPR